MADSTYNLLHVFPNFSVGGLENRAIALINHFGALFSHTIIALNGNTRAKELIAEGSNFKIVSIQHNKSNLLGNPFAFRTLLKELAPDLLLTYNWGSIEWAMANRFWPVVPHVHGEDGFKPDEMHRQKTTRVILRRIFLGHCFKVVVPSRMLQAIAENVWKLPSQKVSYVPNGIDLGVFARPAGHQNQEKRIIGIVASLHPVKNHLRLLRAVKAIRSRANFEVWIIGAGKEEQSLKDFVARENLEQIVTFWGYRKDPQDLLRQIDIFCLSSDSEQMPISVLEAMASGLPIVSTDVGDVKAMVSEANKPFIVAKDAENDYAELLLQLILDKIQCSAIGTANAAHVKDCFDIHTMFDRYRDLYLAAIASKQGHS